MSRTLRETRDRDHMVALARRCTLNTAGHVLAVLLERWPEEIIDYVAAAHASRLRSEVTR